MGERLVAVLHKLGGRVSNSFLSYRGGRVSLTQFTQRFLNQMPIGKLIESADPAFYAHYITLSMEQALSIQIQALQALASAPPPPEVEEEVNFTIEQEELLKNPFPVYRIQNRGAVSLVKRGAPAGANEL